MKPIRVRAIYFNMGFLPVYVGIVFDELSFKAEMKRLGVKDHDSFLPDVGGKSAALHSYENNNFNLTLLITLNHKTKRPIQQVVGLLAHEATHVLQRISRYVSAAGNPLDDETQAYLVQWVTQCAFQAYRRKIGLIK